MNATVIASFGRGLLATLVIDFSSAMSRAEAQPPSILTQPQNQVVMFRQTAVFNVLASGTEPLRYQWRLEDTNLSGATGATLGIPAASPQNAGTYSVVISNSVGAITSAPALLTVIPTLPGSLDFSFSQFGGANDLVRVVEKNGDGKILIGGSFTMVNGVPRRGIARLQNDGSLDMGFDPGAGVNGTVNTIAVQNDGKIVIGGNFGMMDGTNRSYVARLDANGKLDLSFDPQEGPNGPVWKVVLQAPNPLGGIPAGPQRILVGGDFTTVKATPALRLARLNSDGSLDGTFIGGVEGLVRSLAIDLNGRVLVGGIITPTNGPWTGLLVRLAPDGGMDPTFDTNQHPNSSVFSLTVQTGNSILVGGAFTTVGGRPFSSIARLNSNGVVDTNFNPGLGANAAVTAIALQNDGKIVIGGGFTKFNGQPRSRVARLYANGGLDATFDANPGPDNWVESVLVQGDGSLLIGGAFTSVNDVGAGGVARLFASDPVPFGPVIARQPASFAVSEGADPTFLVKVFAFPLPAFQWRFNDSPINGATQASLTIFNVRPGSVGSYSVVANNSEGSVTSAPAALTVNAVAVHPGAPDINFYAGAGPDKNVTCMAVQSDGRALVGGVFSSVDGLARNRLAKFNANGSVDPTFVPSLGPTVEAINAIALLPDGKVLAGGGVTNNNGWMQQYLLVRLETNGTVDATFNLNVWTYGSVFSVVPLSDGKILVGGSDFYGAGSIFRLLANGTIDTNFQARLGYGNTVYAIAVQGDGTVLIGGDFTEVNGMPRKCVARLNPNGTLDPTFNPGSGANSIVRAVIVQPDGDVLIAGSFTKFNGRPCSRIARLHTDGALDASFDAGPGPGHNVYSMLRQPDGKTVIGGTFPDVGGIGPGGIARLNSDGSLDVVFNPDAGANDTVRAIGRQPNGHVLIAGDFTEVAGVPRQRMARLWGDDTSPHAPEIVLQPENQIVMAGDNVTFSVLASGLPLPSYQWQHNGNILAGPENWILTLRNVRITAAGTYAASVSNFLGTLLTSTAWLVVTPPTLESGATDIDFYPGFGPNDQVNAVATQPDGRTIIAGDFNQVDGVSRPRLARLLCNGSLDASFDPGLGPDNRVIAMVLQPDNKMLIAGNFSSFDGTPWKCLARLNSNGSLDSSFVPLNLASGSIEAMAVQPDGRILIGGWLSFTNISGHNTLCRLTPEGNLDPSFNPVLSGTVKAIVVQPDGRILVGGYLWSSGSANVLRLWSNGSRDTSFGPNLTVSDGVNALALQPDGKVIVGGRFTYLGGFNRNLLARLEANGTVDATFDAKLNQNAQVESIVLQTDGKLLIGGSFTYVNTMLVNRIARLNRNGSLDLTFDPGWGVMEGNSYFDEYGEWVDLTTVHALALESDGKLILGGDFGRVNGVPRNNLARVFNRDPSVRIAMRGMPVPAGVATELRWEAGVLMEADHLHGPWREVSGAMSPHVATPTGLQKFYRLRFD